MKGETVRGGRPKESVSIERERERERERETEARERERERLGCYGERGSNADETHGDT